MKIFLPIVVLALALTSCSSTIYVVRHAEKEAPSGTNTMMANDPNLSAQGLQRANALADLLARKKISAVYATPYKRTQQTVQPTATAKALAVTTYPPKTGNQLIDSLAHKKDKSFLIVGHSNTVPSLLRHLGLKPSMQDIPESDFSYLFTVRIKWFFGRKMRLEEKRYGGQ